MAANRFVCVLVLSFSLTMRGHAQVAFGPGPELLTNEHPTAQDIDAISDTAIRAGIPGDFTALLQMQPDVASLFGLPSNALSESPFGRSVTALLAADDLATLNRLAVALVASAIANNVQFDFSSTIDAAAVNKALASLTQQSFVDRVATAIYTARFRMATGLNDTRFEQVMNDPSAIESFRSFVSERDYMNQLIAEVKTAQPDSADNAMLVTYKLYLLTPTGYAAVSSLYQQNGLPVFSTTWNDLLSSARLGSSIFQDSIDATILQKTTQVSTGQSLGFGMVSNTYTTTYGARVEAFLQGPAQTAGYTTGRAPNNVSVCRSMPPAPPC